MPPCQNGWAHLLVNLDEKERLTADKGMRLQLMPCRRPRPAPPEPGQAAEVPLYVTAWQDYLTVYRDMSGESLHRRGYRSVMHRASLNEAAAAGCLLLAGWPETVLSGQRSSRIASPPRAAGMRLLCRRACSVAAPPIHGTSLCQTCLQLLAASCLQADLEQERQVLLECLIGAAGFNTMDML